MPSHLVIDKRVREAGRVRRPGLDAQVESKGHETRLIDLPTNLVESHRKCGLRVAWGSGLFSVNQKATAATRPGTPVHAAPGVGIVGAPTSDYPPNSIRALRCREIEAWQPPPTSVFFFGHVLGSESYYLAK